jgi:lysozyme family protein
MRPEEETMKDNFDKSLRLVLKHEGGYVNHPSDPGGATNKGVTIATFRRMIDKNATVADLKNITDAQLSSIYRKGYWDKVKADQLPSGLDYAVFDFGVNSGPGTAVKYLQRALGVKVDAVIGPRTIAAANAVGATETIRKLCAERLAYLQGLKTWTTFGKGWSSRVKGVVKEAMEMAQATKLPPAGPIITMPVETVPHEESEVIEAHEEPISPPPPSNWFSDLITSILAFFGAKKGA